MEYSLLSRFQGIVLGSLIGEQLGVGADDTSLIQAKIRLTLLRDLLCSEDVKECILSEGVNAANSSEVCLLALPIIMFFHENPCLLTNKLQEIGKIWQLEELVLEDLLLWGRCIALALREKLDSDNFLNQLINLGTQTPLTDIICLVQDYLKNAKSLQQLVSRLSRERGQTNALIALALYCFASTPEDFGLSVKRATHCPTPQITTSLTGALVGAYHGVKGIPLTWRLAAQKNPLFQESQQGAKLLFNHWVGMYQPSQMELSSCIACHNGGTIQARASLKIISQL